MVRRKILLYSEVLFNKNASFEKYSTNDTISLKLQKALKQHKNLAVTEYLLYTIY